MLTTILACLSPAASFSHSHTTDGNGISSTPRRAPESAAPSAGALSSSTKRSASYGGSNARQQKRRLVDSGESTLQTGEEGAEDAFGGASSPLRTHSSPLASKNRKQQGRLSFGSSSTASTNSHSNGSGEQLILDLGQKLQVTCTACQMSYDRSSPEDVALHARHHDRVTRGVEWTGKHLLRAGEVVDVGSLPEASLIKALGKGVLTASARRDNQSAPQVGGAGGAMDELDALLAASPTSSGKKKKNGATVPLRILRYPFTGSPGGATATESAQADHLVAKKLQEVSTTVDEALGAAPLDEETRRRGGAKIFLAIVAGRVVGAAVTGAVPAGSARRVVDVAQSNEGDRKSDAEGKNGSSDPTSQAHTSSGDAIFLSSQPLPEDEPSPILGVHRIYVLPSLRRLGVGSRLLDAVLDHSVYGQNAEALLRQFGGRKGNVVAFSQPTEAGRRLAEAWLMQGSGKGGGDGKAGSGLIVFQEE